MDDVLYNDLLKYLAARPWAEVNGLISRLVQSRAVAEKPPKAARPKLEDPAALGERSK